MDLKAILLNEIVKNGHAKSNGNRIWNMANRSFLQLTPEMSQAFLNLINFEPYKQNVFNVEIKLLKDQLPSFLKDIGKEPFNLIDIGCGEGSKAKELIKALDGKTKVRYCPISSDNFLINIAAANVHGGDFKNLAEIKPVVADFDSISEVSSLMRTSEFRRNVILLHGSILASYEINEYLFNLSRAMLPGDYIMIGNSIRKGERLVGIEKYKSPIFKKWFMPLMGLLGFNENEIEYDARFNQIRVEGFFRIKKAKKIKHEEKEIEFKKGDEILVAILYKYYLEELETFIKMYFNQAKMVKSSNDEYMMALCKK